MELQIQGNIAVKAHPIRLLALCTAVHEGFTGGQSRPAPSCCIAQSGPINRIAA
jgi:hypothetical protein